jgi:RHS repeat-associated protein
MIRCAHRFANRCNLLSTCVRFILTLALMGGLSLVAWAQAAAARPNRGVVATDSYAVSDIERVNLTNGNLNLSIPLASLPPIAGGKLGLTLSANYNSKMWDTVRSEVQPNPLDINSRYPISQLQLSGGGWSVGARYFITYEDASFDYAWLPPAQTDPEYELLTRNRWGKIVLHTPDGATHELRPMDFSSYTDFFGRHPHLRGYYKDDPNTANASLRYYSFDGSHLWVKIDPSPFLYSGIAPSWTLYLPDGTKVEESAGIQRITDTNGNKIKIWVETDGAGVSTTYHQDELTGREIKYVYNPAGNGGQGQGQVQYQTVGGAWMTITVNYGTTRIFGKTYWINDAQCPDAADFVDETITVIRSIIFPQTEPGLPGKQFTFNYSSDTIVSQNQQWRTDCFSSYITFTSASQGWGSLSRIVMPSGATIDYTYTWDGFHVHTNPDDAPRESLETKTLTHDGVTDTWTYLNSPGGGGVTNPDGSQIIETMYPYDRAFAQSHTGFGGKEGLVYRIDNSGKTRVERHWTLMNFGGENIAPGASVLVAFNPVVDAEYTTLMEGGLPVKMSAKTFQYDFNCNLLQETHYDWFDPALVSRDAQGVPTGVPPGAVVLRVVNHSYYNQATTSNSPNVYARRDLATVTPRILNAPQQTITGPSQTQFSYDNQAYGVAPTIGNLTRVSAWDDQAGVWRSTNYGYDSFGNKITITDPRNNVTNIAFDPATHAQPTQVTVNPLNGTGAQTTTTVYDYWTGLVTSVTDPNNQTTTTDYTNHRLGAVDPFGRPGVVTGPPVNSVVDGVTYNNQQRKVKTTYFDAARQVVVESDLNQTGDYKLKSRSSHDQLGRVIKTESNEEGAANYSISTENVYIQPGLITLTSNPKRIASAATDGWTRATRDLLGRVIEVATFSGAAQPPNAGTNSNWTGSVTTIYTANQTTVTDQAGKKRRSETDALGRLVKVIEDPGGLGHETFYLYDVLDNLRKVTQGAQTRWFAYDSLSRLIRVKNPEQSVNSSLPPHTDPVTGGSGWAMAYSYDANGNLTQRIDARGVIANYSYDALNRSTGVDYINGSQARSVRRVYDGAINGKGRFFFQWTQEGGVNATRDSIESYDALGRPLVKWQHFWRGSDWGTPYVIQQSYDLASNVKTLTYPSGHTVNYSHDQMGRLSGFSGNLGGGASVNYADTISYNAAGQMIKERFGANTLLYHNNHYNSRLQLVSTRLGDSATDAWNWSRGAIDFLYGATAVASGNPFANDTDNNGNLRRQINYAPLAAGGYVIPQQHDYTYDALNRIATVRERQRNGSGQWADSVSQAYSYDRWGNRTVDLSGGSGAEAVWFDDSLPAGAVPAAGGGDGWNWMNSSPAPQSGSVSHISNIADWLNWSPPPYSGNVSHQSNISSGFHQHQYFSSPTNIPVRSGGTLYAYIYIDPENIPQQVMLQWGTNTDGWEHRAYWGANIIGLGTDGTASRRYMGPLPAAGGWVRLEVPASAVGLEGKTVGAMAFTLYGGRANWDLAGISGVHVWQEHRCDWNGVDYDCYWVTHQIPENYVLVDDSIPAGSTPGADGGDSWNWRGANNVDMVHQHYFHSASNTLQVSSGDKLFTWLYLDPANTPSEAMLQWHENGSWEHRAYWGANKIDWGVDGTASRRYMGPLPQAGGWVKLEIPASAVGLEGKIVNGMAFTLFGGRAAWDKAGKVGPPPLAGAGPPINNRVYTVDAATNRLQPPSGSGTMQYDAAGNLEIDAYTSGVSQQFVYDGENRLVEAYNGGVRVSWYVYDAAGRRVVRTVGSQTTWQVYGCGGELLAEYAVGAAPTAAQKEYGYRNGQLLVVWDGSETGDRQLQWLVQDHLGSTRMVVDRSGSLAGVRRHDFAPFGEELFAGVGIRSASIGYSVDSVRQKFTGHERDDETGLDYMQARYFSSLQGRFTGVDPLMSSATTGNPQSWNRYTYVLNNPLRYVDLDGLQGVDPWSLLTKEEQTIISSKLKRETITNKRGRKRQETNREAFKRIVGAGTDEEIKNKVTLVKNFIDTAGGHTNSAIWQEITEFKGPWFGSGSKDGGGVTFLVKNKDTFLDVLGKNGYAINPVYDVLFNKKAHPNDSAREITETSWDTGAHMANDDSSNLNLFLLHWDKRSTEFKKTDSRYWTKWGEQKEAGNSHHEPFSATEAREGLRKRGVVPAKEP